MGKYEDKIQKLIAQMTLEEKIGQLQQCGPSLVGAFEVSFEELLDMMFDGRISEKEFGRLMSTATQDFHEDDLREGRIGSYNGICDAKTANHLQKIAVEETRLGIPLLFGYDVIHGFRTVTPIPLAESCAWEPKLWERTARMAAQEATSAGIHMTFAPMVDVSKDARWGRVSEGAGEDVLLNAAYGAAKVRGYQGEDLSAPDAMLSCLKHFAAYGAGEAGRDYNRVDMSRQRLREEYLPPYKACIDAGARAVMPAFNDINGVPCTANEWLLQKVLRQEWNFDGMTVSDANAIAECVNHGIAKDLKEAAQKAINAGVDMDMTSNTYAQYMKELIETGEVREDILNRAAANVLRVKFEAGLFDHPYRTDEARQESEMLKPEYRRLAKETAVKSMVLLKNDKTLPLKPGIKVGILGELAASREEMTGAWAIGAKGDDCVCLLDAFKEKEIPFCYIPDGASIQAAEDCDVYIAAIGERKDQSGEAASRADITIPAKQLEWPKELTDLGKPVVAVVFNGRPLAMPEVLEYASAILEAWHPGVEAGNAIVDILYGKENPSGKLTMTFPHASGQCPLYYAHTNTGRPGGKSKFTSKYLDVPLEPLFPFGYGLSYTHYEYENLSVQKREDSLRISVEITNTGERDGEEIVQCYVRDVAAKRVRPVMELKAFDKISIKKGETKTAEFIIKYDALGYYDQDMEYVTEPGEFIIFTGGNAKDCISQSVVI